MSVYFARVGSYLKIGFSENPERRVRRLFKSATRYSAPADAPLDVASRDLLRHIDGTKDTEALIHQALDDFRVEGEWFVDEPELRAWIATAETATEYEPLPRAAGPVFTGYDEPAHLEPADLDRLHGALGAIFAAT